MAEKKFVGHNPFPELSKVPKNINEIKKAQAEENKNFKRQFEPGEKYSAFPVPEDADYPGKEHKGYDAYEGIANLNADKTIETAEENIENPEIATINENLKEAINQKKDPSIMERLRDFGNRRAVQIAITTILLFSKAIDAKGGGLTITKDGKKQEWNSVDEYNAFVRAEHAKKQNLFKNAAENFKLDVTNFFETDKAEISKEEQQKLSEEFSGFLNTINAQNFKESSEKNWVVRCSSDERETSNWKGSNENLTNARAEATTNVLKETLQNHKFGEDLTAEQVAELKNKEIGRNYPKGREGKENGVTYVTDKVNEKTGKNYTEQEVANLKKSDPEGYQKLLESCRYTNFEVESTFFNLSKYDKVHFLVDQSGSMASSKRFISSHLRNIEFNKPITLNLYSDQLDPNSEVVCQNNFEAADKILADANDGSFREKQVDSALGLVTKLADQAMEKQNEGGKVEKQKIYVATDEALQGINSTTLELLKYKADQANIDVEFLLGFRETATKESTVPTIKTGVAKLSLDDLIREVNNLKDKTKKDKAAKHQHYFVANKRDAEGKLIPQDYNTLGANQDHLPNQKLDAFYKEDLAKTEEAVSAMLNVYPNFRNFLTSKGYGKTATEIVANMEKELSGSGDYAKMRNMMNFDNLEQALRLKYMGHGRDGNEERLADDVRHCAASVRTLIEAKQQHDLITAALKGVPEDQIPNISDNVRINLANFNLGDDYYWDGTPVEGTVIMPINGPTASGADGWKTNLTY